MFSLQCFAIPAIALLAFPPAFGFGQTGPATVPALPQNPSSTLAVPGVVLDGYTPIVDPKLSGGEVRIGFHLAFASGPVAGRCEVFGASGAVAEIWNGTLVPGAPSTSVLWDGKDALGAFVDTGSYEIRLTDTASQQTLLVAPLHIVRLGITEIEFRDSLAQENEWQMVYFKKGFQAGVHYATPAICEYSNLKPALEISDMDQDSGEPRPAVSVHNASDEPVMNGSQYETQRYNYPLAYLRGTQPRIQAKLGTQGTSATGSPMGAGYPIAGYDLRLGVRFSTGGLSYSSAISPGHQPTFDGDPLPNVVGKAMYAIEWHWQYSPAGTPSWTTIPGTLTTEHRIYTLFDEPIFRSNASGTQYAGPWVEVLDYFIEWDETLGFDTSTDSGIVETFVKGFVTGSEANPVPIEDVLYDTFLVGGDGGATHYYGFGSDVMNLSALLNGASNGFYVNCTDNMGCSTTMLSMLGIENMKPLRLGGMTLRGLWGIGTPGYTLDLWAGNFPHGFSYHHIATRTDGVTVIDTCLQLDEDGNPDGLPGIPGWNVDRPWAGPGGYDDLSSLNSVTTTLEVLPFLQ